MTDVNKVGEIGYLQQDTIRSANLDKDVKSPNSVFAFKTPEISKQPAKLTEAKILHAKWINLYPDLSEEFFENIEDMAKRLKCKPEDLSALIYQESKFNPKANGAGKHHGLAQMTTTSLSKCIAYAEHNDNGHSALNKKMDIRKFVKLSREKQLPYVEAYLNMIKDDSGLQGKSLTGAQLWCLILSPAKINNKSYLRKVEAHLDSIKNIPNQYEVPKYLKKPHN